jgi:hypothetical protein
MLSMLIVFVYPQDNHRWSLISHFNSLQWSLAMNFSNYIFNYILLILRIKLLRNSLRNHPEIPNNTKNQNSEQKEIRIHTERSQQQKSNDNSENLQVNCVFIFAYDNNCLYWIENKLFIFIIYLWIQ